MTSRNAPSPTSPQVDAVVGLRTRGYNFDPTRADQYERDPKWRVDDSCTDLPPERPGPPEPNGVFEQACGVLRRYEFADPSIVVGIFDPAEPLQGRNMLLVARFGPLRFRLGVRVSDVLDRTEVIDDRLAHRWGWSYRTLEGHLERGQMDYEVRKWDDTGEVTFRIHAYSQWASVRNPAVWLGLRLFGRRTQRRFHERALARIREITAQRNLPAGPADAGADTDVTGG